MSRYPLLRLSDVADVVAGDPAPQDPEAFAPDGPLFIRMQDVGRHHLHPALSDSADRLNPDWVGQNRLRLFPKGSVLIPKSGASVNLNHRAKLGTDAYVVSHLAVLTPDTSMVDPDFLYWWSVRYDPRAQAQVTSLPSLKLSTLKKAQIHRPPLEEQRRIVDILNRAAKIERLRAEAAECLREFVPALFLKMFGDPATNPMGWKSQTLGELSTLGPQYGANAKATALVAGQPRYVRITDIQAGGDLSGQPVGINASDWEPYRLIKGDLLFARSGATVGKAYLHRREYGLCVFAGYLIRFRLAEERLHPLVAFAFTQTPYYSDWVKARRRTAAQPNINGREYASLELPVPDRELQEQFVGMLNRAATVRDSGKQCYRNAMSLSASLLDGLLDDSE